MKNRNFTNLNEFLNIRYIRRIDSVYMDPSDFDYMIERFKKIYEENTKLKAEIEQLKAEIEQWQSTNLELVCELTRTECENNQLKSELEQSVKLPCKVGDYLYSIEKYRIRDQIRWNIVSKIVIKDKIEIHFEETRGFNYLEDFGKTIFPTKKEAEQALKGKVKE